MEKSTVPVKAAESIRHILREAEKLNPERLSFNVGEREHATGSIDFGECH